MTRRVPRSPSRALSPASSGQYFQAAVFEHHPDSPEPVQLRLLGDAVRDRIYPFGSHQAFQSFQSAPALRYGQAYALEGTSVRAVLVALLRGHRRPQLEPQRQLAQRRASR